MQVMGNDRLKKSWTFLKCKFDIYPPTKEIFFLFEEEFSLWILTSYTYNTVFICVCDCLFVCLFQ